MGTMDHWLQYTISIYGNILKPFGTEDFGPKVATGLLLAALTLFIAFVCAVFPQALRLHSALSTVRGRTKEASEDQKRLSFQSRYDEVDSTLSSNKLTSAAWAEFRKTLIFRETAQSPIILASARPSQFFTTRSLRVQYDFVRSLPNFFVGIGLLGTFIGLIAALTFSTESLTSAVDQEQIKRALSKLLTTAAAKFYISAAGLVASLLLSLLFRLILRHLSATVHQLNDSLEERLLFVSEQKISERQLSVQQESLTELKLFNTNIAMRIGDAVRQAVEQSNDSLTTKLSEIADSFSKLIEASGAGAGKAVGDAMKGAFENSLADASNSLNDLASELKDLPSKIEKAAKTISDAGIQANKQQAEISQGLKDAVSVLIADAGSQLSTSLAAGTSDFVQGLAAGGESFSGSVTKMEVLLAQLADAQSQHVASLSDVTRKHSELQEKLGSISQDIVNASQGLVRAGSAVDSNLAKVLSAMESSASAANDFYRAASEMQASTRGMIEALQKQMSTHLSRFNAVDEKLATVFKAITDHLEYQSKQMSDQLGTMDQALARAVNQFEQLLDELAEVGTAPKQAAAE
jgi:rubrerythrin